MSTPNEREKALYLLADTPPTGTAFFDIAAQALTQGTGWRWAGVALLREDKNAVDVATIWDKNQKGDTFSFDLPGSPCHEVYKASPLESHVLFRQVVDRFPTFQLLADMGAYRYQGEVFRDEAGAPLGHIFAICDQKYEDSSEATMFFRLVSQRVGTEYNRWCSEEKFSHLFRDASDGILLTDINGAIFDANQLAIDLFTLDKAMLTQSAIADLPLFADQHQHLLAQLADNKSVAMTQQFSVTGKSFVAHVQAKRIKVSGKPIIQWLIHDITELKSVETALRQSEARFKDFAGIAADGFWELDEQLRYTYISEHAKNVYLALDNVLGQTRANVIRSHFKADEWQHLQDRGRWLKHFTCLEAHKPSELEYEWPCRDGKMRILLDICVPILDEAGHFRGYRGAVRDVTESHQLARQLTYQANHDALTGLINRRAFEKRLQYALNESKHYQINYVLCYVDLDQFKVVNDTVGHVAGDELLKQIATLMQNALPATAILARLGGDEFGVLLIDCLPDQALDIANTVLREISLFRFNWQQRCFELGASIGLAPLMDSTTGIEQLFTQADMACYLAKDAGRNQVCIYHEDNQELMQHQAELLLVTELREALLQNRFQIYFQQIQAIQQTSEQHHYEALLRMVDQAGNMVSPGLFIPAAERYGLMPAIDRWVIKTALTNYATWFSNSKSAQLSINLSGTSLADEGFLTFVIQQFMETNVPANAICFEITETAAINNLQHAISFITELREFGSHFALDDFGSGLSSFSYLKQFPIDYLKIDGCFVRNMEDDPKDHALVEAINHIGHIMGIKTIAEYVENDRLLKLLANLKVDYVQGYAIGKPRPAMDHVSQVPTTLKTGSYV